MSAPRLALLNNQGNLFAEPAPAAQSPAPASPAPVLLRHKTCGQRAVIERVRTVQWCAPGETELFCTHCGWVIHPLHVEKDVEK